MKVKVIPVKKNKNIIYVPENIEYFLADDPTADVVQHLELGYENIKNRFPNLTLEEYEELNSSINKNNPNSITHIPDRQLDRLIINISNDCNMRCKYCYANQGTYGSEKNMISIECLAQTLNTIFGIFKEVGLIQLFGGEPTLNIPAIKFVGQYLLENNRKTKLGMVTNATIVNEQLIELIKKYDIKLTVSVDVERLHNDLRPFPANQPSWEKVRKNIHRLKAETGQPSQFEVTYTKLHEDAGLTIGKILDELKTEYGDIPVHIAPVCSDDARYHLPTRDAFIDSVNEIYELKKHGKNLTYSTMKAIELALKHKMPFDYFCGAGISTLAISTQGDIYPCFYFIDNLNFKVGNVFDNQRELKQNILQKRQELLEKTKQKNDKCKECYAQAICTGCLGANYTEMGDPFIPSEEHCTMTKSMMVQILKNAVV